MYSCLCNQAIVRTVTDNLIGFLIKFSLCWHNKKPDTTCTTTDKPQQNIKSRINTPIHKLMVALRSIGQEIYLSWKEATMSVKCQSVVGLNFRGQYPVRVLERGTADL